VQQTKECSKCGKVKPLEGFNKDRSTKDGYESACKGCERERGRRYREANREAIRERKRRYRKANLEAHREYARRWREANRETERARGRRYREANPELERARRRRWHKANPQAAREYHRRAAGWYDKGGMADSEEMAAFAKRFEEVVGKPFGATQPESETA
jgi:hypothetical protein